MRPAIASGPFRSPIERALHPLCAVPAWSVLHPLRVPSPVTPAAVGLRYQRVRLRSADGTRLAAWFVPRPKARAGIVLCHGHNDSRAQFVPLLRPLHEAGFQVLLFDFRSMGVSGGSVCTYGYREREDALAAVEWLHSQPGVERLGIMGISMGGATALLAAASYPQIEAVVTDCAFARLEEMVEQKFRFVPRPVRGSVSRSVRHWAEHWSGTDIRAVDPEAEVRSWRPRPLLAIHAGGDLLVPPEHGRRLAKAAGPLGEHWEVPGAWHARCRQKAGRAYVERVTGFLRKALGAER